MTTPPEDTNKWKAAEHASLKQLYEKQRNENTQLWSDVLARNEQLKAATARIAELEQQLDLEAMRNTKRQAVRDAALERLAEMLPTAEEQARNGKTALLRLIIRALR